jgi:hypothetical protein
MLAAFTVKNSLVNLLAAAANGRYEVSGAKNRKADALDIRNTPQVTVSYKSGQFPRSSSSINGPYQHEASISIDILVAAEAEADLAAIKNPDAETADIAAALAAKQDAETLADQKADEAMSLLFDIIMRPQNNKLGMEYDVDRWIAELRKSDPSALGDLVVLAAGFTLTVQVPEYTTGEEGVPGTGITHNIGLTADVEGTHTDGEGVIVAKP